MTLQLKPAVQFTTGSVLRNEKSQNEYDGQGDERDKE